MLKVSRILVAYGSHSWTQYIRGEYWLSENGDSEYADGDIGDRGHEDIAVENILNEHYEGLEKAFISYFTKIKAVDPEEFEELLNDYSDVFNGGSEPDDFELAFEGDHYSILRFYYDGRIPDEVGAAAFPPGQWAEFKKDVRLYYAKYFSVAHVINNNFSVWKLSPKMISSIQGFILDQANENGAGSDGVLPGSICIEEASTGKYTEIEISEFLTANYPGQVFSVQGKTAGYSPKNAVFMRPTPAHAGMWRISRILKRAAMPDIASKFPPQLIELLNKLNSFGQFYLVGGSVRDALLGRVPKDFDIMVVSPTPEELEKRLPVKQVGAAFPVYLYDTGDPTLGTIELAYARKEVKTGIGYKGFSFEVVNDVKEDLARRDLTINALAWNPQEGLVSFDDRAYQDIETQTLQHVTEAFAEDPVRVLRAARFSSQLPGDWKINADTIKMMNSLKDELLQEPSDRIREELHKALQAAKPGNFFLNLDKADCLEGWFPEVAPRV